MKATEISAAYAALQDKWPELRPKNISSGQTFRKEPIWYADDMDDGDGAPSIDYDIVHAACFMACLTACAERGCVVVVYNRGDIWHSDNYVRIELPASNVHAITEIMPYVMAKPKVTP